MARSVEAFADGLAEGDEAAMQLVAETLLLHRVWLLSKMKK